MKRTTISLRLLYQTDKFIAFNKPVSVYLIHSKVIHEEITYTVFTIVRLAIDDIRTRTNKVLKYTIIRVMRYKYTNSVRIKLDSIIIISKAFSVN